MAVWLRPSGECRTPYLFISYKTCVLRLFVAVVNWYESQVGSSSQGKAQIRIMSLSELSTCGVKSIMFWCVYKLFPGWPNLRADAARAWKWASGDVWTSLGYKTCGAVWHLRQVHVRSNSKALRGYGRSFLLVLIDNCRRYRRNEYYGSRSDTRVKIALTNYAKLRFSTEYGHDLLSKQCQN